ncbi:MAG: transcription termination/antitermination factor NusG [Crocinitomicaceae bacterium]|jgi:transcriptional antiterminator NusG|nr:transcription termination/antitermination factor NusG [Crocinitomicaceae bacterium]|tara:strand:- start:130 stop:681 length:552 start_codon:yes stop_codon:yes gene_type:complete
MSEVTKKWYVIRAVSGKEKKVKELLELEIDRHKLNSYVDQVLIPTEKIYQIRKGKKISKEKNYFPGYVLIQAALVGEVEHVIKSMTNIIGFLGATKGGDPLPMRQSEVNRILGKVDELAESDEEMNIPYVVGESVKVIDGPFNNFNGTIENINEEKKKLTVMVKIFGRKTPLELNYMQVDKDG